MRKTNYPDPTIAKKIDKVLREDNISDTQVAARVGMERKSICRYRNGDQNPSIKFIRWLCSTYHIDANWLLNIRG